MKNKDRLRCVTSFKQLIKFERKICKNTRILRLTYKRAKKLTVKHLLKNNNQFEKEMYHEKGTFEFGKCSIYGSFGKNKKTMIIK